MNIKNSEDVMRKVLGKKIVQVGLVLGAVALVAGVASFWWSNQERVDVAETEDKEEVAAVEEMSEKETQDTRAEGEVDNTEDAEDTEGEMIDYREELVEQVLGVDGEMLNAALERKAIVVMAENAEVFEQMENQGEVEDLGKGFYKVAYEDVEQVKAGIAELSEDERVEQVAADVKFVALEVAKNNLAWGVETTGLDKYIEKMKAKEGVIKRVAVLDTGVNAKHEAFRYAATADRIDSQYAYDFVNGDSDATDDMSHGTYAAGVVAEATSENVKIVPVKVLSSRGEGGVSEIVAGINQVSGRVDVINMSFGIDGNVLPGASRSVIEAAIAQAKNAGAIVVAAAGNGDGHGQALNRVFYPASSRYVVAVGAVDRSDAWASYSNYGPELEFAAPGSALLLPYYGGGYKTVSGTSFASPFVAAAIAMVKAENPGYNNDQVLQVLRNNAVDRGAAGRDQKYGYGSINFNSRMFGSGSDKDVKETTPAVQNDEKVIADGVYTISALVGGGKVMDISGAGVEDGANVQSYASNGTLAQKFLIRYLNNGYYRIENYRSGKVLDVSGAGTGNGVNVWQYTWNGTAAQQWRIVKNGDGSYNIIARVSGRYLDVSGASTANGANIWVYNGNGTKAQKFGFTKVGEIPKQTVKDGNYVIKSSKNGNFVLDIAGGSKANHGNVQLYKYNGTAAQKFQIRYLYNGYYRIANVGSGKVLDVHNYVIGNGANIQQYAGSGVTAQQWRIVKNGDGSYSFYARCSDYALDVSGASMTNGANIQTWQANGTNAQKFILAGV